MKGIRPDYYRRNGSDLFDFFELMMPKPWVIGFYVLNIIKYVVRFPKKNGREDLLKAQTYLSRLIEFVGKKGEKND